MRNTIRAVQALALLAWAQDVFALDNGLAMTPPMGYNTWNAFHDEINETIIYHAADELVESGLAAAGYVYLVIDGTKPCT
jgi:alpha-galactosidase